MVFPRSGERVCEAFPGTAALSLPPSPNKPRKSGVSWATYLPLEVASAPGPQRRLIMRTTLRSRDVISSARFVVS